MVMTLRESVAVLFAADFVGFLCFQGGVYNAVTKKLLPCLIFYSMGVLISDYMHSRIVAVSVKASYVYMVNICYAVNGEQMIFYFSDTYTFGHLLKENVNDLSEIFHSVT